MVEHDFNICLTLCHPRVTLLQRPGLPVRHANFSLITNENIAGYQNDSTIKQSTMWHHQSYTDRLFLGNHANNERSSGASRGALASAPSPPLWKVL